MNDKDRAVPTLADIITAVKNYAPEADIGLIERAYFIAAILTELQLRLCIFFAKSG